MARLHEAMATQLQGSSATAARFQATMGRLFAAAVAAAEAEEDSSAAAGVGECRVGSAPANARWNRYRNVLPKDGTRVQLARERGGGQRRQGGGKYVNASYVSLRESSDAPASRARFIATQGPLPETCFDFWEMAAATQATAVVMLTVAPDVSDKPARASQGARGRQEQRALWRQCAPYFPMHTGQSLRFAEELEEAAAASEGGGGEEAAQVTITCTACRDLGGGAAERDMEVRFQEPEGEKGAERILQGDDAVFRIKHYQYHAWPDHGVPSDTVGLRAILKRLMSLEADVGEAAVLPLSIVHCSAGIGRTGSFLLAWAALEEIEARRAVAGVEEIPDFGELLVRLRQQRGGMVQGLDQFIFSFQLTCDALRDGII